MAETLNGLLENFKKDGVKIEKSNDQIKQKAKKLSDKLDTDKSENDKAMVTFKKYDTVESKIIKFNVGGALFSTTRLTLIKKIKDKETDNFHQPNIFEGILNGYIKAKYDENRAIFIDRNPKYFGYILDYLRMAGTENEFELPPGVDKECLNKEAKFFNLRGLFNLTLPLFDSKILNEQLMTDLLSLCQFSDGMTFKLLYRASRDGFAASSFHSKCDNIYKTITIVKTNNGNIFGGYTAVCWDQSSGYKTDNNAYIFSLVNLHNSPIKIACSPGQNAIYCNSGYGPTFGSGHDFHIADNSNSNQSSYSKLSTSYIHPDFREQPSQSLNRKYVYGQKIYLDENEAWFEPEKRNDYYEEEFCIDIDNLIPNKNIEAQNFLAGSYNFYIDEIEIFQLL